MRKRRSLFEDDCCHSSTDQDNRQNHESVNNWLTRLTENNHDSLDTQGHYPEVLLVNKGTDAPLTLGGTTAPTIFSLKRYNPVTRALVLTFEDSLMEGEVSLPYVTDSRSLAGVVFLNNEEC